MYGMVNRSLEDMIESAHGHAAWEQIKSDANVDCDIFVSVDPYPDEITYRLVGSAAAFLNLLVPDFLEQFGIHWILKTGREGYPDLMACGGRTFREFLLNLPNFHQRVSLLLPHLDPPEFRCSDIQDHSAHLHYYSRRAGLSPFVIGLLKGLGQMFDTPVSVSLAASRSDGADHDEFLVTW